VAGIYRGFILGYNPVLLSSQFEPNAVEQQNIIAILNAATPFYRDQVILVNQNNNCTTTTPPPAIGKQVHFSDLVLKIIKIRALDVYVSCLV